MYVAGPAELQSTGIEADTFEALAAIAIQELEQMDGPAGMVCGPITTGGTGHQMNNFEVFNSTIRGLKARGIELFDQTPYEFGLRRLAYKWEAEGNEGYCMPILTVFYGTIFKSGHIGKGWFIPGYTSSHGAKWERRELIALGIPVHDITRNEIHEFLKREHTPQHVAFLLKKIPFSR